VVATGKEKITTLHANGDKYVRVYSDKTCDGIKKLPKGKQHNVGVVDGHAAVLMEKDGSFEIVRGEAKIDLGSHDSLIASEINSEGNVTTLWSDFSLHKIDITKESRFSINLRDDLFDNAHILVNSNANTIVAGSIKSIRTVLIFDPALKSLLKRVELTRDVDPFQIALINNSLFIAYNDALKRDDLDLSTPSLATILQNRNSTLEITRPIQYQPTKHVSYTSVESFGQTWESSQIPNGWDSNNESSFKNLRVGDATKFVIHCIEQNDTNFFKKTLQSGNVRQNEQIFEHVILQNDVNLLHDLVQHVPDLTETQIITTLRFVLLRLPEYSDIEFVLAKLLPSILNYQNVNELMVLREISQMTDPEVNALLKFLSVSQDKISTPNFAMWLKLILDGHFKKLLSQPSAMKSLQLIKENMKSRLEGYNQLATLLGQTKVLAERKRLPSKKDKSGLQYTITVFK
jgi:hypothetical protein